MQEQALSINDLLSFAKELDVAFRHRKSNQRLRFVFDTNVIWALNSNPDFGERDSGGHTERILGTSTAQNLMQWSARNYLGATKNLSMLSSHKKEVDLAFFDRHNWEYSDIVDSLNAAVQTANVLHKGESQDRIIKGIIEILRDQYEGAYNVLQDVTSLAGQRKSSNELANFASKTTKLLTHNNSKINDAQRLILDYRLDEVRWVLKSDPHRSAYSIKQDIKALRELAVANQSSHEKTILLTLDKRLIDAVRLTNIWTHDSCPELPIESFDTFWIWLLESHTEKGIKFKQGAVRQIMDDFRHRVRTMFLKNPDDPGNDGFWPASHNNFSKVCSEKFKQRILQEASKDEADAFNDFVTDTSDVLDKATKATYPEEDIEELREICERFFAEVNELVAMLQIRNDPGSKNRSRMEEALCEANLSVEKFFDEIQDEISEHAQTSLRILGTGTIFAPRILQAINTYLSSADVNRQTGQEFVYRLPLPIQSDQFALQEVLKLVSEENASQRTRFERLLSREIRSGPIADLLVAYFLVHAGDWEEARRICEASRRRSSNQDAPIEPVLFETFLLEAEILRIYQTNRDNLEKSRDLLGAALRSDVARPRTDLSDIRIRLELCAVEVNQVLITLYHTRELDGQSKPGNKLWVDETLHSLFSLRSEILSRGDRSEYLGGKLLANVNTHILLLTALNEDAIGRLGRLKVDFIEVLQQGIDRVDYERRLRISSFEKVVLMYGIFRWSELIQLNEPHKWRLKERLLRRLGNILQRKFKMSHYEFWIFREIRRALE